MNLILQTKTKKYRKVKKVAQDHIVSDRTLTLESSQL